MNSRHPDPRRMWKWGWRGTSWTISRSKLRGQIRDQITDKIMSFFKKGNLRRDTAAKMIVRTPRIFFVSKKTQKSTIWTLFSRVRFLVRCLPNKEGPGAHMAPGPYGPRAILSMGLGPYGPWPIWAMAHMALAHMGHGPYGLCPRFLYLNQVLYLNRVLFLNQILYLNQICIIKTTDKPPLAANMFVNGDCFSC